MLKLARGLASVLAFCCVSVHAAACDRVKISSDYSITTFTQTSPSIINAFFGADDLSKLKDEIEWEPTPMTSNSDCRAIDLTEDLPGLESLELSKELGLFRRSASSSSAQVAEEIGTLPKPNRELWERVQSHCDFKLADLTGEDFVGIWKEINFTNVSRFRRHGFVHSYRHVRLSEFLDRIVDLTSYDVNAELGTSESPKSVYRSELMNSNLDEQLFRLSNLYVEHSPQMLVAMSSLYVDFGSNRSQKVGSKRHISFNQLRREALNAAPSAQVVIAISRNILSERNRDVLAHVRNAYERNQSQLADDAPDNSLYSYRGSRLAMR